MCAAPPQQVFGFSLYAECDYEANSSFLIPEELSGVADDGALAPAAWNAQLAHNTALMVAQELNLHSVQQQLWMAAIECSRAIIASRFPSSSQDSLKLKNLD